MSNYSISKTRLFEGVWEGIVSSEDKSADQPHLEARFQEQPLDNLKLVQVGDARWTLRIPIPAHILADGVQTILVQDIMAQETLEVITIISGEAIAEDIRAEMDKE